MKITSALYSVGTYDANGRRYTPQAGVGRSINITIRRLRMVLKALRKNGYSAHRRGPGREDNDSYVMVERTDGEPKAEILKRWLR